MVVSLNPQGPISESTVVGRYEYAHPVFDLAAIRAQRQLPQLQGQMRTYFAGAWAGYGFHEDGLKSGLAAAEALRVDHGQGHMAPPSNGWFSRSSEAAA